MTDTPPTTASQFVADITAATDRTGPYFIIVVGIICFAFPAIPAWVPAGLIGSGLTKLKT
jgi:hypothetical protein